MSAQTDQLEDALSDAQQVLLDAINAGPYDEDVDNAFNAVSAALRQVRNDLLLDDEQAILDALSNSNTQLQALNKQIDGYNSDIDSVAATLKKVGGTVSTVAGIIGGIVTAGVL